MNLEIWIPVVVSVVGAIVSITGLIMQRRKVDAEADKLEIDGHTAITGAAITLVEPLRQEIATVRQELIAERAARRKDADECKAAINRIGQAKDKEISLLQTEVTILRNQVISLKGSNTKLRKRITDLENDTGPLRTPPPHQIPQEEEGSDFTDPPPSKEAPEDWD